MSGDSDDLGRDVRGWIHSESIDAIADYVARGRKYSGLSVEEAKAQWVLAFRSLANDFVHSQWWQIQSDLTSELSLRGQESPYDLVVDEMEKLSKGVNAAIQSKVGDESAGEATLNRFLVFQSKRTN